MINHDTAKKALAKPGIRFGQPGRWHYGSVDGKWIFLAQKEDRRNHLWALYVARHDSLDRVSLLMRDRTYNEVVEAIRQENQRITTEHLKDLEIQGAHIDGMARAMLDCEHLAKTSATLIRLGRMYMRMVDGSALHGAHRHQVKYAMRADNYINARASISTCWHVYRDCLSMAAQYELILSLPAYTITQAISTEILRDAD